MNKFVLNIFVLTVSLMLAFSGCKDDENDAPSPEVEFLQRIATTWTLQEATKDNKDLTEAFPGMKLTIDEDRTFTVENAMPPMWPEDGSFVLTAISNGRFEMTRNDDMVVTINSVSETTLVVELDYQAPTSGGRSKSVSGNYEFTFVK